jgi:tellurite methyltransferase
MEAQSRTTTITGFHRDDAGDWVAELGCGHSQHVRHRPPWQVRPWVMTDEGRGARVGTEIECPLCPAPAASRELT